MTRKKIISYIKNSSFKFLTGDSVKMFGENYNFT